MGWTLVVGPLKKDKHIFCVRLLQKFIANLIFSTFCAFILLFHSDPHRLGNDDLVRVLTFNFIYLLIVIYLLKLLTWKYCTFTLPFFCLPFSITLVNGCCVWPVPDNLKTVLLKSPASKKKFFKHFFFIIIIIINDTVKSFIIFLLKAEIPKF